MWKWNIGEESPLEARLAGLSAHLFLRTAISVQVRSSVSLLMGFPLSVVDGDQLGKETHVFVKVQAIIWTVKGWLAKRVDWLACGLTQRAKIRGEIRIDPQKSSLYDFAHYCRMSLGTISQ